MDHDERKRTKRKDMDHRGGGRTRGDRTDLAAANGHGRFQPTHPERAVTVTAAKNVCFENTISVSGVVAPKREVLVRPDREGLQILQINARRESIDAFTGRCGPNSFHPKDSPPAMWRCSLRWRD